MNLVGTSSQGSQISQSCPSSNPLKEVSEKSKKLSEIQALVAQLESENSTLKAAYGTLLDKNIQAGMSSSSIDNDSFLKSIVERQRIALEKAQEDLVIEKSNSRGIIDHRHCQKPIKSLKGKLKIQKKNVKLRDEKITFLEKQIAELSGKKRRNEELELEELSNKNKVLVIENNDLKKENDKQQKELEILKPVVNQLRGNLEKQDGIIQKNSRDIIFLSQQGAFLQSKLNQSAIDFLKFQLIVSQSITPASLPTLSPPISNPPMSRHHRNHSDELDQIGSIEETHSEEVAAHFNNKS